MPTTPSSVVAPAEPAAEAPTTYRLHLHLTRAVEVRVGRLGTFRFPAGDYVYTGSARRHLEARVARHCRRASPESPKPLRWHVDYLLACPEASVVWVERLNAAECAANQAVGGIVLVSGFGASDCRAACGSHLRYLGSATGAAALEEVLTEASVASALRR